MGSKLGRNEIPSGLSKSDFKCYGPPATADTEFSGTRMADMGCFQQEAVDSNKYYHACMCTDPSGNWYIYVEYGRVGATNPQFLFTRCSSEADAQKDYEDACKGKNTKRGEWQTIAGQKMFRPIVKKGKPEDLYVVRDLATRDVGLPDGKNISSPNHAPVAAPTTGKKTTVKKSLRCDAPTTKLMRDLLGGAVTFTRSQIQGGTLPTLKALEEGRNLLNAALQRVAAVGDDAQAQVNDKDLKQLTYALYGKVPKIKPLGAAESSWILSKDNIQVWQFDLDAFETALQAGSVSVEVEGDDPFATFPTGIGMEWIDPKSELGQYLLQWWPGATKRAHHYGTMRIKNLWKVERKGDMDEFKAHQQRILKELGGPYRGDHRPLHQDKKRYDLTTEERKIWWDTNAGLTFHGTRTVNVPGILRENLRLPKTLTGVVITGAMFGSGLYFADDWMKSNGYTSDPRSYWSSGSGGVKGRAAFMFACDTVMGAPHLAPGPKGYTSYPKDGNGKATHCIFGRGGHSGVQHNEWIIFDRRPVLRYLAEFTTG